MDVLRSFIKNIFPQHISSMFKIASFAISPVSVRIRAVVFKLCVITTPPSQNINHDAILHKIIHTVYKPVFLNNH